MAEYVERGEFEYVILHEDVEIAEHKCKDYESYISGANQFRHQMKNAIRKAPAADVVEVRHGEWIERIEKPQWLDDDVEIYYEYSICGCSCCGESPYCPSCGAKMDGREKE